MAPKTLKELKQRQKEASIPITKIETPLLGGNQEYFPKPPLLEEKHKIYISQVIIPLTILGETHAYMGP